MARVLIITADIGAGHDLPAERLADALAAAGAQATIVDGLEAVGGITRRAIRDNIEAIAHDHPEAFDSQYRLLQRPRIRAAAAIAGTALAGRALLREVRTAQADIVVSTYPGATVVLANLRRTHHLTVPLVSAITDLAALEFWAHPGVDLHLLIHPESVGEVRHIAGEDAAVAIVRGLSDPAFEAPPTPTAARAALGLPQDGRVVAVSGGGWGVGDVAGAARLARAAGCAVIALCGTNASLHARLSEQFAHDGGVLVMGFTDRMPEVLSAADVLIHSTAGLTVLEALVCGARPISFGWGVGHVRVNNRAYAATGLADVAEDLEALSGALDRALESPIDPDASYADRPSAAASTLELLA